MRNYLGVAVLTGLVACGPSLGASYQKANLPADPMKSIVYIYRPSKFMMKKASVQLGVLQHPENKTFYMMELHSGGYIAYVADAGKLTLTASALDGFHIGTKTVELDLQPQKEYFVRARVDSLELAEVTPAVGEREIRELNLDPGGNPQPKTLK